MHSSFQKIGPVMLDVARTSLDRDDIKRLKHAKTGGVILFSRNFVDRAGLIALTSEIKSIAPDLLIAVDHEGGRVQRFKKDGFTHLPAMRKLGELWDKDVLAATECATAVGYVLAAELRACGIDLSFTPVLDLDYGPSTVIGNRAFHHDPRTVTLLAKSLNHGLLMAGMHNCGKHFPGHGFVEADSHVAMPVGHRNLADILRSDARPYEWLGMSLSGVMPAHVIYPKVDALPAGFSPKWLRILRDGIGFGGAIFSDDLSMEGARVAGNVVHGAEAAFLAGCDMVLICNSPDKADEILAKADFNKMPDMARSMQRISELKPKTSFMTWESLQNHSPYNDARLVIEML